MPRPQGVSGETDCGRGDGPFPTELGFVTVRSRKDEQASQRLTRRVGDQRRGPANLLQSRNKRSWIDRAEWHVSRDRQVALKRCERAFDSLEIGHSTERPHDLD